MISEEKITSVFETRPEFDENEYIIRENLEKELSRALLRFRYILLSGESGCGKTWLTRYVIKSKKYKFINLSEIRMMGGFIHYFESEVGEVMVERSETMKTQANAIVAAGGLESNKKYHRVNHYLDLFLDKYKNNIIVLDNFESIINNEEILNDLSCIITMADDPKIVNSGVKFIIIGATSDLSKYFEEMPNYQTIANRVSVVKIAGFNSIECEEYVKGRFKECGFGIVEIGKISEDIRKWTDGLPQSVCDLCYEIAISFYDALKDKIQFSENEYIMAIENWLNKRLIAEYSVISGLYNENIKTAKQNNYILYALKKYKCTTFSYTQVQAYIDELTPNKEVKGLTKTGIKKYLQKLSETDTNRNILVQVGNGDFKIKSYKTYACIEYYVDIDEEQVKLKEVI